MNRRRRRRTGGALSGSTSSAELSLVSKKILKVSLVCLSVSAVVYQRQHFKSVLTFL
jgi:hypothetical protein